jgi:hypothetical protein
MNMFAARLFDIARELGIWCALILQDVYGGLTSKIIAAGAATIVGTVTFVIFGMGLGGPTSSLPKILRNPRVAMVCHFGLTFGLAVLVYNFLLWDSWVRWAILISLRLILPRLLLGSIGVDNSGV